MPSGLELLKTSINFYRDNFKTVFGIVLLPLFALLAALVILFVVASFSFLLQKSVLITFAIGFLLLAGVVIANLWQQVALLTYMKEQNEALGVLEYYRRSKEKLFTYFATGLLYGLAIVGGFFLLIIPGIIFMVWFSLATLLVVFEDMDATGAMRRSKEYIKGHSWQVFARLFFVFGVLILTLMLAGSILASGFGEESVITMAFSNIISIILSPIAPIYIFEIYKSLKNKPVAPSPAATPEPNEQ